MAVKSPIIDKDAARAVVTLLSEAEAVIDDDTPNAAATTTPAIQVVDAFLLPKLHIYMTPLRSFSMSNAWLVHENILLFLIN